MTFDLHTREIQVADGPCHIKYLVCAELQDAGFDNFFSTREGGVSPLPLNALNLAYRDDTNANVDENRRRFLQAIACPNTPLVTFQQTHSTQVQLLLRHHPLNKELNGDAVFSRESAFFLGIKTADCVPVLIGDPSSGVLMAIHAGWKGSAARIVYKTIHESLKHFSFNPKNAVAAIGPHACGRCYEVGEEVYSMFKNPSPFRKKKDGKFTLDLGEATRLDLIDGGLSPTSIMSSGFCTMEQNDLFFSHRKEGNHPMGRQLSIIGRVKNTRQSPGRIDSDNQDKV